MSLGIGLALFVYILGAMLGSFYAGLQFNDSNVEALFNFQVLSETEVGFAFATFKVPIPNTSFFSALGSALTWNSPLWLGWASYLRLAILMVISAMVFFPIIVSLFGARVAR